MLTIVVVDRQAESRTKLVEELSRLLRSDLKDIEVVPRVTVLPLARQELKFHAAPDICVIGSGIVDEELSDIANIRKLLPNTIILARPGRSSRDLAKIEQLARMGVDDILPENIDPNEFLKKIILLSRRTQQKKSGTLIVVDSGKGGLGVTSIVAGLGELLTRKGKKVALIDCDFETQDLSRFLQARPYLNENLQQLFDHTRPVTQEFVTQCLVPVWDTESGLFCMPPVGESDALYDSQSTYPRTMISILEVVDSSYDCVIVDAGCARGAFLRTLYRLADQVVFAVSSDPATLFASVDRLRQVKNLMAPDAQLTVVASGTGRGGLAETTLSEEFSRILRLNKGEFLSVSIPWCKAGARWPGSGASLLALAKDGVARAFEALAARMNLIPAVTATSNFKLMAEELLRGVLRKSSAKMPQPLLAAPDKVIPLPGPASQPKLPEPQFFVSAPKEITPAVSSEELKLVSGVKFS